MNSFSLLINFTYRFFQEYLGSKKNPFCPCCSYYRYYYYYHHNYVIITMLIIITDAPFDQ